jgi:hypothetical protein
MNPKAHKTAGPLLALLLAVTQFFGGASAQAVTIPLSTQFDMTGYIQSAKLDPTCVAGDVACGGTITINNQLITVPRYTILQMPAAALTWQEVFAMAPAPYGMLAVPPSTGLASGDSPKPVNNYEAHVVGNRVGDQYIAGLIFLSQHSLQSGQGYINAINYATGEMRVGGTMGNATSGARVKINDPAHRFGRLWTPDARFTIDENNPTVRSGTGYPMCLPRVAPPVIAGGAETDPLCPQANRPKDAT